MNMATLKLAAQLDRAYAARYDEYLEERESYYRQGYRPHYCEHGTDNWTDWDNICGYCENGVTMGDPIQRMQRAISEAKDRMDKIDRIFAVRTELQELGLRYAIDLDMVHKRVSDLLEV